MLSKLSSYPSASAVSRSVRTLTWDGSSVRGAASALTSVADVKVSTRRNVGAVTTPPAHGQACPCERLKGSPSLGLFLASEVRGHNMKSIRSARYGTGIPVLFSVVPARHHSGTGTVDADGPRGLLCRV